MRLPIVVFMKTIITALLLAATAAWGSEYWIQVLAMQKGEQVDTAFQKRLEASGYAHKIVEEQGMRKVRLGAFGSYKEALEALMGIRCGVALDAFIVGAETPEKVPAARTEEVPEALAVVKPAADASKADKSEAAPSKVKVEKTQAETEVAETPEAEAAAPEKPCVCICDKHALRKAEIGAAISFYKESPYHRFEAGPSGWLH
jgi:hypothetical protein